MAGPNYAATPVRYARIAVTLLHHLCKTATLINNRIQDSAYSSEVKTASATWHDACETFCALVEVAYQNLPD